MKKSYVLVAVLLFSNILVAIALNVIASKIAEQIHLSRGGLLITTIVSLLAALLIGLLLEYRGKITNDESIRLQDIFLSRVITVIPTAIVLGIGTAYFCKILIPFGKYFSIGWWSQTWDRPAGPWNYEVLGYLVGLVTLYAIAKIKNNYIITIAYSIGFGISVPVAFESFYPGNEAIPIATVISWVVLIVGAGIIMHTQTIEKLRSAISRIISFFAVPR